MRRLWSRGLASLVLAALLSMSACSGSGNIDGDLVNQWPAMAAPTGWEPMAGTCHEIFNVVSTRDIYAPVPCDEIRHASETVHIGQFSGADLSPDAPPANYSAAQLAAWSDCDKKAAGHLGADWRLGRIWVDVIKPSISNWNSGARWYRCDVGVQDAFGHQGGTTDKSLKNAFVIESWFKHGCLQHHDASGSNSPILCSEAHNAEFAGLFEVDEEWSRLHANSETWHSRCRSVVASYVGVPDDSNVKYRTGTIYMYPTEPQWKSGDHHIRCLLWIGPNKPPLTRSLKGTGPSGLPLH